MLRYRPPSGGFFMEKQPLHITFILAHPDDEHVPFGLPAQLAKEGHSVSLIALTKGDLGSHVISSRRKIAHMRKKEFEASGQLLGASQTMILNFSDGTLHHQTKRAERKLLQQLRLLTPNVIIIPNAHDYHKDHRQTYDVSMWAAFHLPDSALVTRQGILRKKIAPATQTLSVYEMDTQGSQTWQSAEEDTGKNTDALNPVQMIYPIDSEAIEKSIHAFAAHKSQLGPRGDGQVDYIELAKRGAMRRGKEIGSEYGAGLTQRSFGGYAFSARNILAFS